MKRGDLIGIGAKQRFRHNRNIPQMYTYAQVEAALAATHRVRPSSLGAFRGRIKHFQRLGLVPESPGKGRKISYKMENVYS